MDLSITLKETIDTVEKILSRGIKAVGFVSPSHVVPQVKAIIRGLRSRNLNPVTVYNTNSYDSEDTIESLDGEIDVYLPDFKYNTPVIAQEFSGAADYPRVALKALKTMYRQRGSTLQLDSEGRARSGMLIRHLVIPNHAGESERSLSAVAGELSNDIHVSLMSQYYPNPLVRGHPVLGRTLLKEEYESVVETMERLGFRNGWIQELDSHLNYRPDFRKDQPFD
jgi:putative pyruvate formate lyase activating enzyme